MKRFSGVAILVAAWLAPSSATAHGTSKSYAEWNVSGRTATLRVSFAAHDVVAAVPALDLNADGRFSAEEIQQGAPDLAARTVAATKLFAGEVRAEEECFAELSNARGIGDPVEELQVNATFLCPSRIGALSIRTTYLPELEPPHVSVATVIAGAVTAQHVFSTQEPELTMTLELPTLGTEVLGALVRGSLAVLLPAPWLFVLALGLLGAGRKTGFGIVALLGAHAVGAALDLQLLAVGLLALAGLGAECLWGKSGGLVTVRVAGLGAAAGLGLFGATAAAWPLGTEAPLALALLLGASVPLLAGFSVARIVASFFRPEMARRVILGAGYACIAGALGLGLHMVLG